MVAHHFTILCVCGSDAYVWSEKIERERERNCLFGWWESFEIFMERMFEFSSFSATCLKGKGGINGMMDEGEIDEGDSVTSSSSSSSSSSSASQVSVGVGSCESDSMKEVTSSASSSSSSPPPPSQHQLSPPPATSLHDMSSLFQHLPVKRGLSKYFQGKSQSFTCLSEVGCLEDLAKPENPYNNKKLKAWKSYGGGLSEEVNDTHSKTLQQPRIVISRKTSRGRGGCCSPRMNLNGKSSFLLGNKPPIPIPSSYISYHK